MKKLFSIINRKKGIRSFYQFVSLICTYPLYLFGLLVPKQSNIWIFGNIFGYRDNACYLFEYVRTHHPEITPVWIYRLSDSLPTNCSDCYACYSVKGLYYQYRAKIAFASTGKGDFARFSLAKTNIIQLWHGIPIKRILLDSKELIPFSGKKSWFNDIAYKILRNSLSQYSMIIASSTKVQARLASAFGVPKSKIAITGYPRHDIIMEHAMEMKRRILYAPTWRKDIKNALAIVRMICNVDFINCLRASGFDLWISIHPLNASITHVLQNELGNTVNFIESNDINIELARCEVLITDYSSIAVDFSLLGRKVIFFAPDIDEYKMTTGLYSEFETIISENVADTIENICHVLKNNDDESYSVQDETYFHYRDSGARKRIVDFVKTKFCQ